MRVMWGQHHWCVLYRMSWRCANITIKGEVKVSDLAGGCPCIQVKDLFICTGEIKKKELEMQCCHSTMCHIALHLFIYLFIDQGFKLWLGYGGWGWCVSRVGVWGTADIRQVSQGGNSIIAKSCGLQKASLNEESLWELPEEHRPLLTPLRHEQLSDVFTSSQWLENLHFNSKEIKLGI